MVFVALITAASALIVAAVTGLNQMWQLRAKTLLDRKSAEESAARAKAIADMQVIQSAIRSSCAAIQAFQDELELIIKAAPGSILSSTCRNRLSSARDAVLRNYVEHHTILQYTDRDVLHAARELAINVLLMLDLEGTWQTEFLTIKEDSLIELERASAFLGIRHSQLLLSAVKLLDERSI